MATMFPAEAAAHGSGYPAVRQKPGPVTIRGIVASLHHDHFTLATTHRGNYLVFMTSNSRGRRGKLTTGSHVGVHGFLTKRTIRAMWVRIFPVKPAQRSLRGRVRKISASTLTIVHGGSNVVVRYRSDLPIRLRKGHLNPSQLVVGDKVLVRIQGQGAAALAVRMTVYRASAHLKQVRLKGIVRGVSNAEISLVAGGRKMTVSLDAKTLFYAGRGRSHLQRLRPGEQVTVYACCLGTHLRATSIHVRLTTTHPRFGVLRGVVTARGTRSLVLATTRDRRIIALRPATRYEVGRSLSGPSAVLLHDHISVRGYPADRAFIATRVHVFPSFRLPRTLVGPVLTTTPRITVSSHGKRYVVLTRGGTRVSLGGKQVSPNRIRIGDRVRAKGRLDGSVLTAVSIVLSTSSAKMSLVRGVLELVTGHALTVSRRAGATFTVAVDQRTRLSLNSRNVGFAALFPGLHVVARGAKAGSRFLAASVSTTVREKNGSGRILLASGSRMVVLVTAKRRETIQLPAGLSVRDQGRRVSLPLHQGAFVRFAAYAPVAHPLRAFAAAIIHPVIDSSANVEGIDHGLVLVTSRQQRFLTTLGKGALRTAGHDVPLTVDQVPVHAKVHVKGVVQADGSLLVTYMLVRLPSFTERGRVVSASNSLLKVTSNVETVDVELRPATTFVRGAKIFDRADLVIGDDVTVYGYRARTVIFARKIAVHRKLVRMDGVVASLNSGGFILTSIGGPVRVTSPSDVVVSGGGRSSVVVGAKVHVTGYRRGDGSIVATRIRLLKK